MKIAVLSGKGGTGKTTVSTSLAISLPICQYIDCDVEEPNGSIFLKPKIKETFYVKVPVPKVDADKCTGCGSCGKACQFNAIAVIKNSVLIFPEICHHCGACIIACKNNAIYENKRTVGIVESNENNTFIAGKLNIGEPISIPVIKELKKRIRKDIPVILDCSPGASCTIVKSIENCDYCILVTEPTPFGLHDLKISKELIKKMNIPFGIVLNKAMDQNRIIHDFCCEEDIELLMEIPFSKDTAKSYSKGFLPVLNDDRLKNKFIRLYERIERSLKV